jgi:putative addiction module component (TIGR02574 family)
MMDKAEILTEIKKLPGKDRLQIAEIILESLHPVDPEIEAAWIEEASKRLKAVKAGKMGTVPGDQVMEKARQIIEENSQHPLENDKN